MDDRILFKLSISPYSEDLVLLQGALSAMPGHDYEEILLTYGNHQDTYEFSERLISSMLAEKQWPNLDPQVVFGAADSILPGAIGQMQAMLTPRRGGLAKDSSCSRSSTAPLPNT
ncbi:MAG: hypothetical protein IPL43_02135 [Micropruina sp.]|nr:hypothetical protein [Micropruina sp.]